MMTRKDFQELADVIRRHEDISYNLVRELGQMCAASNPAFKKDVFYRACGLPEMADN